MTFCSLSLSLTLSHSSFAPCLGQRGLIKVLWRDVSSCPIRARRIPVEISLMQPTTGAQGRRREGGRDALRTVVPRYSILSTKSRKYGTGRARISQNVNSVIPLYSSLPLNAFSRLSHQAAAHPAMTTIISTMGHTRRKNHLRPALVIEAHGEALSYCFQFY